MSEEIKNEKIRKVFLDELPRIYGIGANKDKLVIDWTSSIGYKIKFIYEGLEGEIEIIDYNSKIGKIKTKYNDEYSFISYAGLISGGIGRIVSIITDSFKVEIGTIFKNNKRDLIITNREYRKSKHSNQKLKWYKYTCNKCGWTEGYVIESDLLTKKRGCGCCGGNKKVVVGINDIPTTAPWMIPYFQGGYDEAKLYTKSSAKKIYPICPDCGKIRVNSMGIMTINATKSISCDCSDKISYPNKFMYNVLSELKNKNIIDDFKNEVKFDWCTFPSHNKDNINYGIFDFVVETNKVIIEMDGGMGHGNASYNKTIEESNHRDRMKDLLAIKNGYKIIRINCDYKNDRYTFIRNNTLGSEFSNIFNCEDINFDLIDKNSLKNIVKECCNYWDEGVKNTLILAVKLNIDRSTVIEYLKKGNDLGWCCYNAKEEMSKSRNTQSVTKPIICIETGEVFESATDCAKQSLEVFGVKMDRRNISKVCLGKGNTYKKHKFKFIKDLTNDECLIYKINNKNEWRR